MQSQRLGAYSTFIEPRVSLCTISYQVISHKEGVKMQFPVIRS